jgi:hypothetical protein
MPVDEWGRKKNPPLSTTGAVHPIQFTGVKEPSPVIEQVLCFVSFLFLFAAPKAFGVHLWNARVYQWLCPAQWLARLKGDKKRRNW